MDAVKCPFCSKNKTALCCDGCQSVSCKKCSVFVDKDYFELLNLLPEDLQNKMFCPNCFNSTISDKLNELSEVLDRAREINVFDKKQGKETRLMRRQEKLVHVHDIDGKDEALLSLAFIAAQKGYNSMVDVELVSKKVKVGGKYQKLTWSGSATPIQLNYRPKT